MKRVAIFLPGAIGHTSGMHVPAIVSLVDRLSLTFDITVYSFIKLDGDDHPFNCGNARVKYIRAHFDDSSPKKVFQFTKSFWKDHRKERFHLLHGFWALPCGWIAVVLGKMLRIPSLVSLQGSEAANLPAINYGDMRAQPKRSLVLWTCNNTNSLALLTQFQLTTLHQFGLRQQQCHIIPHGTDPRFFVKRVQDNISPPVHFLHVGFSNRVKDQETLLRAFRCINEKIDSQMRILGGGPLEDNMKNIARTLGIAEKVDFIGYVPHNQLPEYYQWAHIMLHTSLYEGQGVVIAEAAASKVLVCGTNVGLISDLGPKSAVSVPVGDFKSLADKILRLFEDQDEIIPITTNAFQWASTHNADWTANEYRRLYDTLMSK
jgi:glycosyltransferase involved in cell wall biosynthesis